MATDRRGRGGRQAALRCWAVCTPGLEQLLADELRTLRCRPIQAGMGGVAFGATVRQLYAANLWLRTANRVVVRFEPFTATTFRELQAAAASLPWADHLARGIVPTFRVSSSKSRLYHTDAIAERLENAVADAIGWPSDPVAEQLFVVRLQNDRVQVSVDSSGEALHKRGYRLDVAKAPLRETLAAATVLAAGYDGTQALVDPFCGSGTIGIEAAMIGRDLAPGAGREFAFGSWPTFQGGAWGSLLGEAGEREQHDRELPPILLSDRDDGAVAAATANAERAGVADVVTVRRLAVSDAVPPDTADAAGGAGGAGGAGAPGLIVTNPPYGRRVGDPGKDLRDLYARFGQVARRSFPGWRIAVLAADNALVGHAALSPAPGTGTGDPSGTGTGDPSGRRSRTSADEPAFRTDNGGIPVTLHLLTT